MERDLLHPSYEQEKNEHKLKRLVQAPNSYFMDVKCSGCKTINSVFSSAQGTINCVACSALLGTSTGGKLKLVVGTAFRLKN